MTDNKQVGKRLEEVRIDKRIKSTRAFALSVNADPSFLSKIIKGERPLTEAIAEDIVQKYGVNKDWLYTGKGDKYSENPNPGIKSVLDKIILNLKELQKGQDNILSQQAYARAEIRGVAKYLILQDSKEEAKSMEGLLEIYRKLVADALGQDEKMDRRSAAGI